jgi:hypothetical protein
MNTSPKKPGENPTDPSSLKMIVQLARVDNQGQIFILRSESYGMFNNKRKGSYLSLLFVLVAFLSSSMVAFYAQTPFVHNQDASAQSNATATNQTAGVIGNQSMQNQTSGPFGNLTRSAFDPVINNMNEARDALHGNDNSAAFVRLNRGESSLFVILNAQDSLPEQFQTIKNLIESSKDALIQKDSVKALEDLNSASSALFTVTQQLPPDEGEAAGTEEGSE